MRPATVFVIFFLFQIPFFARAQKEADIWLLGEGKQIRFQSGDFEYSDFENNPQANSTICDKDGNLLLYTDGYTVWNSKNEILVNGTGLVEDNHRILLPKNPVFVPFPKKDGWYILLYETIPQNGYNIDEKKLVYAEINSNASSGRGEVVTKNNLLHSNYHSGPTIAGYCDNSYYWLVIDRNNPHFDYGYHRDIINIYKIDENGVNTTPKVNSYFDIGNSNPYHFSPNGDKLFFTYQENRDSWDIRHVIADFNFLTGELYNYRLSDFDVYSRREFSPDSRFMYFFAGSRLIQVDARHLNASKLNNSAITVIDFPPVPEEINTGIDLQVAPDGKLYFLYYDVEEEVNKLGRLNQPNKPGLACEPELNLMTFTVFPRFPEFVTSFFREKNTEEIDKQPADAGPELKICSESSDTIGTARISGAQYLWKPDSGIGDPFSSRTIFTAPKQENGDKDFVKILRVSDGNCWIDFDTTKVTVLARPPKITIDGSWSVCPYVEEVDYWAEENDYFLDWSVNGGEISFSETRDSVKINWWDTNFSASVGLVASRINGCTSDTSFFPVRINVELVTETPKGPIDLCIAEAKNVTYQIRNTNGSVYDWFADGGEVVSGQGTNEVVVNWKVAGEKQLSVKETSVTIDTICYGESEPLMISVINDSLNIELTRVSYNSDNNLEVYFSSDKLNKDKHIITQLTQNASTGEESEYPVIYTYEGYYIYPENNGFPQSKIISVEVRNTCNEIFWSNSQQSIVLTGLEDGYQNNIQLNWNNNRFWENQDMMNEIWHSTDGNNWEIIDAVDKEQEYLYLNNGLSLHHYFRIREWNKENNLESWSNTFHIELDDDLEIPNVFTPNGDGFNDVWEIKNVRFHAFSNLTVFDKYGKKVYECKNEFIPWNGKIDDLTVQGTYLYQISFEGEQTRYGQVTVLL